MTLGPVMIVSVLFAALLHAVWNSLAHAVPDRLVGLALIGLVDTVGGAVMVALAGPPPAAVWPYLLGSVLAHAVYNGLLALSYQLGEFSQMYPLARGTSPWVVALASVTVLGRPLPATELAGVLAVSGGLLGLVLLGGRPGRKQLPAIAVATLTGLMIATYTVLDGLGVTRGPLLPYIGWLFFLQGLPLLVLAAARRGPMLAGSLRACAGRGLLGGVISLTAYSIVLWAQTGGALAPVAALRETSIVFGALIGSTFLGEHLGRRRALAASVVLAGVLLISLP